MPVYSMTGYACLHFSYTEPVDAEKVTPETPPACELTLELRGVNSRFLDVAFKLPEELRALETSLRETVQRTLKRGKVELRAHLHQPRTPANRLAQAEPGVMQQLANLQDRILTWLPQAQPLTVADVLRLSHTPPSELLPQNEAFDKWVLHCMQQTLEQFQAARRTEGEQLAASLRSNTSALRELCQHIQPLLPQLVEQQRQRFLERWQAALQQTATATSDHAPDLHERAQERALSEATAYALRIDVGEELVRLQAHLDAVDALLEKGGEMGKRLDFLMQELHREANTLGSKSGSLQTTQLAMDMKILIEQMREQVQNIE
ncbi:MAG: YicC/YloC family endoribonuclease [Brachymonas sp.]|nr:YicC/YloC family endoribonuclease [Brachymonas sp.]